MREITTHKVNPANEDLKVEALDGPGPGGASHAYSISTDHYGLGKEYCRLNFQNGPINEVGVNGITQEALLAVLIDRLEGFQSGKFSNDYNAKVLDHLNAAVDILHKRTVDRMARGVEGTNKI